MKSPAHVGRACSRVGCRSVASMTLTYIYAESTAVVGPLATREVGKRSEESPAVVGEDTSHASIGRRGHLRAVPS